ncbi:hypothetical protein BS47DRAFT_1004539 [Hydnum rufescens UP504]|uniref:Uncharacterized protein n=1 Tax=Hydnum rufescens UP504 TaxID=1448309 RepID=A0A9P6B8T7_9AGAM|nr:hypothetical protein BS47DRAFT_1004539 [Hydnum rufescens UP504]
MSATKHRGSFLGRLVVLPVYRSAFFGLLFFSHPFLDPFSSYVFMNQIAPASCVRHPVIYQPNSPKGIVCSRPSHTCWSLRSREAFPCIYVENDSHALVISTLEAHSYL